MTTIKIKHKQICFVKDILHLVFYRILKQVSVSTIQNWPNKANEATRVI